MQTDPPREPHGILLAFAAACDPTGKRTHDEHVRVALELERDIKAQGAPTENDPECGSEELEADTDPD